VSGWWIFGVLTIPFAVGCEIVWLVMRDHGGPDTATTRLAHALKARVPLLIVVHDPRARRSVSLGPEIPDELAIKNLAICMGRAGGTSVGRAVRQRSH